MTFDASQFSLKSLEIVERGMDIVQNYQLKRERIGKAGIKEADKTLVTNADVEGGKVMSAASASKFPELRLAIEDGVTDGATSIVLYGDPLDGTRAFAIGLPTSTVILGAYDTDVKQVVSCVIGEPISGRIWYTIGNETIAKVRDADPMAERWWATGVWPGSLSPQATVMVDVSHGFTRSGRQILTNEQVQQLMVKLAAAYKLFMPGSNGLQQALVADGNEGMAGAITTAIGGPQDVCGVRLVLNARGAARAFRMTDNRQLEEESPLAVAEYDLLIVGNTQATVDRLSDVLQSVVDQ